jgi:FtsP/CotA-like multicopper oxidase with cupredoxin domain
MATRRDAIKLGLAVGGTALLTPKGALAQLCAPDGTPPYLPSPPVRPFVAPLRIMPIAQPIKPNLLNPPPDPARHQRYNEFLPKKFYVQHEQEFAQSYHPDYPLTVNWGFDNVCPGPTFKAWYGEPIFVRRHNDLPANHVGIGLPSTTTHLHNSHSASESDGNPLDYIDSGQFYDYHYPNFRAGINQYGGNGDVRETLTTLWYHDHRMDYTSQNVYAGLTGFYLLFDELDSDNEKDKNPHAFRLPSGKYDIPMIFHDIRFDQNGQVVFDIFNTDGVLGDMMTVNRIILPYLQVEPRKYRFRLLNGGPSRFYEFYFSNNLSFVQLSNDGNMLPRPITVDSVNFSVAQRADIVVDFSRFKKGDTITLYNRLEQTNGMGPTGRLLDPGDPMMQFQVIGLSADDHSEIPSTLRPLPPIDLSEVVQERTWGFDYDGGLWTINGKPFEMDRIDAEVRQGTAEIWTIRNEGASWSHPVHIHFEEFQILEVNGKPVPDDSTLRSRKDVISLMPNDEVKIFMRFRDFLGRYVMHCHNVVHEDHAMMIQFQIVP